MYKNKYLPTATQVAYYHHCARKLWLFAHNINMEHTSALVYEGKLISENTYPQRAMKGKELDLGNIKIDYYDAKNKVVHETKKSNKKNHLHLWQVKYYIYALELAGIVGVTGVLEYPKLRLKEEVFLSDDDREYLKEVIVEVDKIKAMEVCPDKLKKSKCRNCSYEEFCWSGEVPDLVGNDGR